MKILVFDNYDSFTYNLVYLIRTLGYGGNMDIVRNDKIALEAIDNYDKILLSPGPGIPDEAGILKPLIAEYSASKSILGVCLGHQAIAEVFGASLINMPLVLHGIADQISVEDTVDILFERLPRQFNACHYHSWTVRPDSITDVLQVTARDESGHIMGLKHVNYDVRGLQFHPESILTEHGATMIDNWLKC